MELMEPLTYHQTHTIVHSHTYSSCSATGGVRARCIARVQLLLFASARFNHPETAQANVASRRRRELRLRV